MGNLFGGGTESFLLYVCVPSLMLALVVAIIGFRITLARRLVHHGETWLEQPARLQYRTPASRRSGVPWRVWLLAHSTFLWGAGIGAFWLLAAIALVALIGPSPYLVVPMIAATLGAVCCVQLVRASLCLTHRDRSVWPRIARARSWLALHHATVFLVGTGLLLLLVLSNQFFWNGPSDTRTAQLVQFTWLYALVVLVPSALGGLLSRQLAGLRA